MPRATAILREKLIDEEGNIVELMIWKIPVTPSYPLGVRYRLALIPTGRGAPAVLYDNHQPKGPHRHVGSREEPYTFVDVDQLVEDFLKDVRGILGDPKWPRR